MSRGVPEVRLSLPGRELRGDEVGAVLYRHRVLPSAPAGMDAEAAPLVRSELQGALDGALLALDATWGNHPTRTACPPQAAEAPARLRGGPARARDGGERRPRGDPRALPRLGRPDGGQARRRQLPVAADGEAYAIYTTRVEAADLADGAALAACPRSTRRRSRRRTSCA